MLGNYRVTTQLVASRVLLNSIVLIDRSVSLSVSWLVMTSSNCKVSIFRNVNSRDIEIWPSVNSRLLVVR
jgi:hypothetical protein